MPESEIPAVGPTRNFDAGAVARARAVLDAPPEQIGPYRILERLGGGGMGEVYRAEQRSPIRREVALKLIKLGMDTKLVIARFEAERQALAMMDHPHIAKVFDAGAEDTGRPYFIMEYVKGRPITEYADQNHLTIEERLELFQQVCQGIQHAHQKGIIHRDLKPSNVLVSTQDGKPFAKVIDFGIAKAIAQPLTEKTLFTQHEQLLGTPLYMSPEQAEGSLDIDTRTDVYSLGVLLYELLTGSTPFGSEELKAAAVEQIKKMIREVDPPKPSTRISMSGQTLPSLAASRRTEPKKLGTLVRGELDWIVMKSLEKDRARRYDTPTSLADDIQRYLTGQPVVAAPPSWTYRVRKYVRRRKGAVAAIAAIVVLLVGGTLISSLLAVRARRAERQVQDQIVEVEQEKTEVQQQRDQAVAANEHATAESKRATRMSSELCVDAGIAAEDKDEAGLAMLWFVKALKLDTSDPAREEIQRRRVGALYLQHPRPVNIIPPDVPGITKNGLSLQWGSKGLKVVEPRTRVPIEPRIECEQVVDHAEFSPNGKYVLGLCRNGNAHVWEVSTGIAVAPPMPNDNYYFNARFTPDSRYILTHTGMGDSGENNSSSFFELHKVIGGELVGKPIRGVTTPGYYFDSAIDADGTKIVTANDNRSAQIWGLPTGEPVSSPLQLDGNLTCVAFSPNSKLIATGAWDDQSVRIWDVGTGRCLTPPLKHLGHSAETPYIVLFSRDNKKLLTGSGKGWQLWEADTGNPVSSLLNQAGNVSNAAFSPDGSIFATFNYSYDGNSNVMVRDIRSGNPIVVPIKREVKSFGFSSDGKRLVTVSLQEGTEIWDIDPTKPIVSQTKHPQAVLSAAFSPDGKTVATACFDVKTPNAWTTQYDVRGGKLTSWRAMRCVARLWDAATGDPLVPPMFHPDGDIIGRATFAEDGRSIDLSGVWFDVDTGQYRGPTLRGEPTPRPLLASPDGRYVLAQQGEAAKIYDAKTGGAVTPAVAQFACSDEEIAGANFSAFSADGNYLVVPNPKDGVDVWELSSGKWTIRTTCKGGSDADFVNGGKYLIVRSDATMTFASVRSEINEEGRKLDVSRRLFPECKTGQILNLATEQPPSRLDVANILPQTTPDGSVLSGLDTNLRLWDPITGKATTLPMNLNDLIWAAAPSGNGKYVIAGDSAGAVRIWDATSGKPVTPVLKSDYISRAGIDDVEISPTGDRFVIASDADGATVCEFDCRTEPAGQLELLAEYLSEKRIDEVGAVVPLTVEESSACREKLLAECPELFQPLSERPEKKGVGEHYRRAVETQVAAATTDAARKELAVNFSHGSHFERHSNYIDEAILLAETAVKLDDSSLDARDNLAAVYLMAQRYDEALAIYEKFKGQHYNGEWYNSDEKDIVFGQNVPDLIADLRTAGHDHPTLATIESLLAPTLPKSDEPASDQPATDKPKTDHPAKEESKTDKPAGDKPTADPAPAAAKP